MPVVTSSADVTFSTTGQGMWSPGAGGVASASFDKTLFDTTGGFMVGGTAAVVPNPAHALWVIEKAAYDIDKATWDACQAQPVIIIPCGPEPAEPQEPPAFLNATARLDASTAIRFGLKGTVNALAGSVDVNYPTQANVMALNANNITAGQTFTIRTSEVPGAASMTSDFAGVSANLDVFGNMSASLSGELSLAGASLLPPFNQSVSSGVFDQRLLGATVADSGLTLNVLGGDLPAVSGVQVPMPPNVPLNLTLQIPSLDTGPPTSSEFDGQRIRNTHLPAVRPSDAIIPIDFLKLGIDIDGLIALIAKAFGVNFSLEVSVPGVIQADLADLDVDTFWGVGQTLEFRPMLQTILTFSAPTMVETAPGSGVFETVTTKTVPIGSDLQVMHPGGDLRVDVVHSMASNQFTNNTEIRLDIALTGKILNVQLDPLIPSALTDLLGGSGFCAYCPPPVLLGSDISVFSLIPTATRPASFPLGGFTDQPAPSLFLPTADTATPAPAADAVLISKRVVGDQGITSMFTIAGDAGCTATPASVSIAGTGETTVAVTQVSTTTDLPCMYTVTENPVAGYTASPADPQRVAPGGTVVFVNTQNPSDAIITISNTVVGDPTALSTFSISPAAGCTATPSTASIAGTGTVTVTVTDIAAISGAACTYTVEQTPPTGYTATPAGPQTVAAGGRLDFITTMPAAPSQITITSTVTNGSNAATGVTATFDITAAPGCTATPPTVSIVGTGSTTVEVTATVPGTSTSCTYTVAARPVPGYTANPAGPQSVSPGGTGAFTFSPIPDTVPPDPPPAPLPGPFENAPPDEPGRFEVVTFPVPTPVGEGASSTEAAPAEIAIAATDPPIAVTGVTTSISLLLATALIGVGSWTLGCVRCSVQGRERDP